MNSYVVGTLVRMSIQVKPTGDPLGQDPSNDVKLKQPDGTIKTDLSLYDVASCRVTKAEAESLFALGGQHPMQLVG